MDALVDQVLKALSYVYLTFWLLRGMCCADKGSLPQSARQWWAYLEYLQQNFTSNAGKDRLTGVLKRVYQRMRFLPLI